MGKVTITVEHAWTLSSGSGADIYSEVKPQTAQILAKTRAVTPRTQPTTRLPLAAQVRMAVPETILEFSRYYNSLLGTLEHRECELSARDILQRLANLAMASTIDDPAREDPVRNSMKLSSKSGKSNRANMHHVVAFAAKARISLLMLSKCRSKNIREQSFYILCEALDTNRLSQTTEDICDLRTLWIELIMMLKQVVRARITEIAVYGRDEISGRIRLKRVRSSFGSDSIDARDKVPIDQHMENILKVLPDYLVYRFGFEAALLCFTKRR